MNVPAQLSLFQANRSSANTANAENCVLYGAEVMQTLSEHTPGHLHCLACLKAAPMFSAALSPSMSFSEAAVSYLKAREAPTSRGRAQYIRPRTLRDLQYYVKTLAVFFGALRLEEIHLGHLAEYERRRSLGEGFTRVVGNRKGGPRIPSPAGPNKIRSELGVLIRILRRAGCWRNEQSDFYLPLQPVESDIPRALSFEEQEAFLCVASSRSEWFVVWWYSIVAEHTTFSSDEMRTIRLGDINLPQQILSVNRRFGKNTYRRRIIPIESGACLWALEQLIERARERGAVEPQHFLFPFRVRKGAYDPNRPMGCTGIRKPFLEVRKAAHLGHFKINDWRHTAITNLAIAGTPIAIIMARAGHVTRKMSEHYTHISEQAQRKAIRSASEFHRKPVASVHAIRADWGMSFRR